MRESAVTAAAHATTNTAAAATTTLMATASAASPAKTPKTMRTTTGTRLIGGKDFRRHAQPQGGGLFFYMSKECM